MTDSFNRQRFLSNAEKYLPYAYPLLMPPLALYAFKIPVYSLQDVLTYWLSIGFLQLLILEVVKKAVYSTRYNQVIRWLMATIVCGFMIIIFFYLVLEYHLLHLTEGQEWKAVIRYFMNIPLTFGLIEGIKSFNDRAKINMDNITLQNENVKAQFNQLLQQINPHFLFNSLTTLQAMVQSKDKRAVAFIIKLEDVYAQTLKTNRATVTLKEELDFFNAYMYLMTLRQEEAIFFECQVSDESLAHHIPVFSLQLLAENCIKHNIVSEARPLHIRLYQKDEKTLTLVNNYQPKPVKVESFGIGIENLKKRYALAGIENGVEIKQDEAIYETTIRLF